jgi:FMN phosphatase YigB (HAD superfamily)
VENAVNEELRRNLDLGTVTPSELLDHVRHALDWDCDYPQLARAWCAAFTPDPRVLAIARRVTVRSGPLTDNGPPLADTFRELLPDVAAVVSTAVFSSDIAATKPRPDAFRAACRALSVDPARVVFVDDNPENVRGAQDAGLLAVRYTTPEQLHLDLAASHVLATP